MKLSRLLFSLALGMALSAHPMGNFSVNHYTRIAVGPRGADLLYVLDLAEIPTFEILQQWKLERTSPREELDRMTRLVHDLLLLAETGASRYEFVPQRLDLLAGDVVGKEPAAT